ncbi:hypothetical protein [Zeaxanthinibacter enoshimensis]|uniref:Lipoprotein n=1 Tax=Zeaxanthinibacter enoshimensis TaxID=392009 RepID=A0A4R6TMF6_9FLAO|nr:hypothetical protein [Zeaxanthinibacter enoshimensis]TDQ32220.1 hypothetical protein CLV82_0043 [Zeaxanthinibacter enoshimensis]
MRILCFAAFLLCLHSCSSSSQIVLDEIEPEIPLNVLHKNGIAAMNPDYKGNYFNLLPYLFYNKGNTFNEIQGDFYNLDYMATSDINIMTGFWKKYDGYKNALIVLIALSSTSTHLNHEVPIQVVSSKNGPLKRGRVFRNAINKSQQRILFVKELELENTHDVLKKIDDDVISVRIGEQVYEFLNPEFQLAQ